MRNSIVNIVPITPYTNIWKGNKSPKVYPAEIVALGVSKARLKAIFEGHLIDLDVLMAEDWAAFYANRNSRMSQFVTERMHEVLEGARYEPPTAAPDALA